MINFLRNNAEKFISVLAYYILGPTLLLVFIYEIYLNSSGVFNIITVRGRYESALIWGVLGLLLTVRGIVRLLKKDVTDDK